MRENPYNPTRPASPEIFVGRAMLKQSLVAGVRPGGVGFSLVGGPGIGKTNLLRAVERELSTQDETQEPGTLPLPIYVECLRHHSRVEEILVSVVHSLVEALEAQRRLHCPPEIKDSCLAQAENGSPIQDLLEPILDWAFAQENRAHLPILLLDDLHRVCAEAWFPRLASFLQTAVNAQRLSLILAGQQVLIEELRQDTSPLRLLIASQFVLERLTLLETRELVARATTYGWTVEAGCADLAYHLTNGHPYRLYYYLFHVLLSEGALVQAGLKGLHHPSTEEYLDGLLGQAGTSPPHASVLAPALADVIRNLVRGDQLEEALTHLSDIPQCRDEADLLMQQLSHLKMQQRQGTVTCEAIAVKRAQIARSIICCIST